MAAPAVAAATEKPTLLGFVSGPGWRDEVPVVTRDVGKAPAIYQMFLDFDRSWSDGAVVSQLTELDTRGFTPTRDTYSKPSWRLNSGALDARLNRWTSPSPAGCVNGPVGPCYRPIARDERKPRLVGQPNGYKAGYRRIRAALLDEGLTPRQIRFLFAPYGDSSHGFDYEDYYPGDGSST